MISQRALFLAVCLSICCGAVPAGVLSGKVLDDGEPVSEAEVMLVHGSSRVMLKSTSSDARGGFHFEVEPGVFNIGSFKAGLATAWKKGIVVKDAEVSVTIELTPKAFLDEPYSSSDDDCD